MAAGLGRYAQRMTRDGSSPDTAQPAWEAARRAGLDMDLIEDCLRLTPTERIRVHSLALMTALELRRAMEERDRAANVAARVTPRQSR